MDFRLLNFYTVLILCWPFVATAQDLSARTNASTPVARRRFGGVDHESPGRELTPGNQQTKARPQTATDDLHETSFGSPQRGVAQTDGERSPKSFEVDDSKSGLNTQPFASTLFPSPVTGNQSVTGGFFGKYPIPRQTRPFNVHGEHVFGRERPVRIFPKLLSYPPYPFRDRFLPDTRHATVPHPNELNGIGSDGRTTSVGGPTNISTLGGESPKLRQLKYQVQRLQEVLDQDAYDDEDGSMEEIEDEINELLDEIVAQTTGSDAVLPPRVDLSEGALDSGKYPDGEEHQIEKVHNDEEEKFTVDEDSPVDQEDVARAFFIGGVLSSPELEEFFNQEITRLNFDGATVSSHMTLYGETLPARASPVRVARDVCNHLITAKVSTIVCSEGSGTAAAATAAASYTAGYYHIPVISTSARGSSYSNKNLHLSLLRTVPPVSRQGAVWVELLQTLHYSQVVFVMSSDTDGWATLRSFVNKLRTADDDKTIKVSASVEFIPGSPSVSEALRAVKKSPVTVFLLAASAADCRVVLRDAAVLGLLEPGHVWVVSEEVLAGLPLMDRPSPFVVIESNELHEKHKEREESTEIISKSFKSKRGLNSTEMEPVKSEEVSEMENLKSLPEGLLGLRLLQADNHQGHIADSLRVTALALRSLQSDHPGYITEPPAACDTETHWNTTGPLLYRLMQSQVLYDGRTGKVAFDHNGDRLFAEYEVVNSRRDGSLVTIGSYHYDKETNSMNLTLNNSAIIWPGGAIQRPAGYTIPSHLTVLSLEDKPFLYLSAEDNVSQTQECLGPTHAPCQTYGEDNVVDPSPRCCWGYCVRLLQELASSCNFSFDLLVAKGAEYGEQRYVNNTVEWTGLIGALLRGSHHADLIVAPLTISPERAQVIDFSKPFKYQGIAILVRYSPMKTSSVSIVQPFRENLWMILLASVHIIAVTVWLLDRCSPMYKRSGTESDSLVLSEACWLAWGVLLNSGMNEGTPRCLSARVLTMIWAGFAMILLASYTANLAAFLVLEERHDTITGINDPKLRNPTENYTFGTVRGSAVDTYFRQKIELSNMYRVMNRSNVNTAEEGVHAVLNGTLKAFIWDSSRLEFEASRNCELATVGELFGRSGYGIGYARGSPWADKITLDILQFHESGLMSELDDEWIWSDEEDNCSPERHGAPLKLGLTNIEGIFLMVVGGILTGSVLVLLEIAYKMFYGGGAAKGGGEETAKGGGEEATCGDDGEGGRQRDESDLVDFMPVVTRNVRIVNGDRNSPDIETYPRPRDPNNKANPRSPQLVQTSGAMMSEIENRLLESNTLPALCKTTGDGQWVAFYLKQMDAKIDVLKDKGSQHANESIRTLLPARSALVGMLNVTRLNDAIDLPDTARNTKCKPLLPNASSLVRGDPAMEESSPEGVIGSKEETETLEWAMKTPHPPRVPDIIEP